MLKDIFQKGERGRSKVPFTVPCILGFFFHARTLEYLFTEIILLNSGKLVIGVLFTCCLKIHQAAAIYPMQFRFFPSKISGCFIDSRIKWEIQMKKRRINKTFGKSRKETKIGSLFFLLLLCSLKNKITKTRFFSANAVWLYLNY